MNLHKILFLFFSGIFIIGIFVVFIIIILNPNGSFQINTKQASVVTQIKSLNRLETATFSIEKIIDAKTSGNALQDFLFGDKILLIAHGEVIAGFDLSQITQKDVEVSGTNVTITLPPPQILVVTLDNSLTRVYDRKLGILSQGNKDLESEARNAAETSIRDAACQGHILTIASDNAKKQLTALLTSFGFMNVTFIIPGGSC